MRILLTGGAGFIGSCLIWRLNKAGIDDILVVDSLDGSGKWKNLMGKDITDYMDKGRLFDYLDTGRLNRRVDMVIHFGACSSTTEQDRRYLMENNFRYSMRLAKWSLRNKKRFLYASSAATYGDGDDGYSDNDDVTLRLKPLNMYGHSKQLFDLWVLKNRLQRKFVGFKFFNVYGPNEYHKADMRSMVHKGYHQIRETGKIRLFKSYRPEYGDGQQERDFIYIKDALEMVYYFIDRPAKSGIFNIGTGRAQTWNELAKALFLALGLRPRIEYIGMPEKIRDRYQYHTQAQMSKLRQAGCGHKVTGLNQAVRDYVSYLEAGSYL